MSGHGPDGTDARERIARRAALEAFPGSRINLGIGLPTRIPAYLPSDGSVWIHSENGFLGMGPAARDGEEDPDLIDAGGRHVTLRPGGSYFDSALSFALVRSGRIDVCFLGAFEVDVRGDLANWRIPGRAAPGVGGGMELAQRVPRVIVTTRHVDRTGGPKLVRSCTLPRTARGTVTRVVTDLAVLEPTGDAFRVLETAPGVSEDALREATGAPLLLDDVRPWRTARNASVAADAPGDARRERS